jgi:hypothetical protein
MRRYVRKQDLPVPVRKDDYTEPCDRCGAEVGRPCTIQTMGFRQWPNVSQRSSFVPVGTVALRIHWERRHAVLKRREQRNGSSG